MKSSDTAEEFEYSLRASAVKDFGSERSYEPSVSNCYLNGAVCCSFHHGISEAHIHFVNAQAKPSVHSRRKAIVHKISAVQK